MIWEILGGKILSRVEPGKGLLVFTLVIGRNDTRDLEET